MEYIIGIILALLGGLAYQTTKRKSAEGLLENVETKEKNLKLDKDIAKNEGLAEAEKEKRDSLKEEMKEKLNESVTPGDITDFFNGRKK